MSLTIVKRSPLLKNLSLFVSLVLIYIYISLSLFEQSSVLDREFALSVFWSNLPLLGLYMLTLGTIWFAKPISKLFLAVYLLSAFGITFPLFIYEFEKDLLFLNFIFLISGFYFWIFWKLELNEASYVPRFELNELNIQPDQRIPVKIKQVQKQYKAILTNWDSNSCFVILEQSWEEISGSLTVELNFEGQVFENEGKVVSSYGPGVGIKFTPRENSGSLNWNHFYDIINDRGYI